MNSEALKRVLSRPRLPYAVLGLVGILAQAFYSHTPIGIEGDAAGYIELGRFLGGIPGSSFIYFHRPPAYPAFLILTGFIHLNTFRWTLLATAAIGVLCPLLVYSIVSELGRYYALGAALIYVVSTLPFSYSNLLLAEHLYTFLILVATSATCLYLRSGRPAWIYAAAAFGSLSMLTRNEAWFILALILLAAGLASLRRPGRLVHVVCALLLTISATLFWSGKRSQYMHDPAVFGSLSNFAGWQSWGRVYSILGPFDYQLNTRVLRRTMPTGAICPVDLGIGTCLIERSNGPQSRRLANLLDRYMNGQAEEVLHHPTQARTWEIGVMLHEKLGHLKADRLMLRAAAEAYWRHPTAILALLSTSLDYFGISTVALFGFPAAPPGVVGGLFLQRAWEPDDYEMIPFNHAGIGLQTLHGRAREEYARSFRVSNRFLRLHHWAEILGVVIKTAGGLAFLCLLPFILLQALCNKGMGLFLLTLTAILIAAGVLGYGYNPKYEHTIFPAMVMSGAFGLTRLVRPRQSRGGSSAGCSAPSGISWTRSSQNYRGGILSRGASAWPFSSL